MAKMSRSTGWVGRLDHLSTRAAAVVVVLSVALATACGGTDTSASSGDHETSVPEMSIERLASDIQIMSSDEYGGRAPSSPGEVLTVEHLTEQMVAAGLQPGNGDSFVQEVPLVAITVEGAPALEVSGSGMDRSFAFETDWVGWTKRVVDDIAVEDSELVFVGYGIAAPEFGWNDYEGLDMAGKTAVILVNDPGFATQDPDVFRGNAMTYYGRWTYKYEEAARQGADAALIIHQTAPAAYGWGVVVGSWTGPQFDLVTDDNNAGRVAVEGWVTEGVARELFDAAGQDFDALTAAAVQPGFEAVSLGMAISTGFSNGLERSLSNNVIGVLPGTTRPDEYVFYMAHWDHLGTDPGADGDGIYNGAFDNASGTAGLLELARAHSAVGASERSLAFLAVTAEEQGLLGSAYYARYPVVPTHQTVATINMDGLNVYGPMNDVVVIGWGASELDDYVVDAAAAEGRSTKPDPEAEKGYYFRSDHFPFARAGVPAVYPDVGTEHTEYGTQYVTDAKADYVENRYHKPSDEWDPNWDLRGALQDLRLIFRVGHRLAGEDSWPNWRDDSEFRATRDLDREGR